MEKITLDAMVDRFLSWPLPDSVCADPCATVQGASHRSGTNLLSAIEARAMLEHVVGSYFSEGAHRWIPVSEREPERSGEYLTFDGEMYEVARWDGEDFYRLMGDDPPTHWMPLRLEAPK